MKSLRIALMPVFLGACAIHIGSGTGGGAPPPARPAPAVAAAPAPAPAPAAPTPPKPRIGSALPRPGAAPVAAAPTVPISRIKGISHVAPAPAPPPDIVNTVRLKSAVARNAKGCGLREIGTGTYARIDCHDYQPIASAVPHTSARKLKLVQKKQTLVRLKRRTTPAVAPVLEKANAPGAQASLMFEKDDALPDDVDLRTMSVDGPIKNQLMVGSCTAFSLSTAMDNAIMRMAQRTSSGTPKVVSPIDVWSEYGTPKMEVAWESVKGKAITDTDHWSYTGTQACKLVRSPIYDDCNESYNAMPGTWEADPVIKQSMATAKQAGIVNLTRVEKFATLPSDNDELITSLRSGTAIWAAMKIDGSKWSNSQMRDGVIQDWSSATGGHAVAITGFRKTAAGTYQYLIHNSWGTSWGKDGRAWVSEAMVKKFMHYAYKIHVEGDDVPPPAPTPPPGGGEPPPPGPLALSDDDCDATSLIDLLTMRCAPMCGDDSRPWAGQCPSFGNAAPKK